MRDRGNGWGDSVIHSTDDARAKRDPTEGDGWIARVNERARVYRTMIRSVVTADDDVDYTRSDE